MSAHSAAPSLAPLPPLQFSEPEAGMLERLVRWGLVIVLHVGLAYLVWQTALETRLPPALQTIAARLLPVEPEVKPPVPLPPKAPAPAQRSAIKPPPILTSTTDHATSSFVVAPQPPAPPAPAPVAAVAAPTPTLTAARFDADYLHNPKPAYPPLSRRNLEEGKVLLRVRVSPSGSALEVSIKQSSGFSRLDNAAQDTVSQWRFVPARRGDEAVESWVTVPIIFSLE